MIFRNLAALYSWRFIPAITEMLRTEGYRANAFLAAFWSTNDFARRVHQPLPAPTRTMRKIVLLGGLLAAVELLAGVFLVDAWATRNVAGGLAFGAALIVGWPVVVPHVLWLGLVLYRLVFAVSHPKMVGRALVAHVLESQVRRLRARHKFQVVAVVGSIGKTSAKLALANVLNATQRVRWQVGNYNDRVTVPLIFFGETMPSLLNVFGWARVLLRNERALHRAYPYDIVVAELGTDKPGDIVHFAYTRPDVLLVTAVTPEHMEFFKTLDAVAAEELAAVKYSKKILFNIDDSPEQYVPATTSGKQVILYGRDERAVYRLAKSVSKGLDGQRITLQLDGELSLTTNITLLGKQGASVACAALSAAHMLGLTEQELERGAREIKPFSGRMQVLAGIKNSKLIDDTYNASPAAVNAALDVLYATKTPQRIAILGSMNELGDYAPEAHHEVGEHCDPGKLDLVVTVGELAKDYIAPVAKQRGCTVKSFVGPYEAGAYVRKKLKTDAVVLAKGSQNRVFTEESLKTLLANSADSALLVRQSAYWMRAKREQFGVPGQTES